MMDDVGLRRGLGPISLALRVRRQTLWRPFVFCIRCGGITSIPRQIAAAYAIEARICGLSAYERLAVRQAETNPLMEAFKTWDLGRGSPERGVGQVAARQGHYTLNHWDGFTLFLDDGRIEVDNSTVERDMRPTALGMRNRLFIGSESGAESGDVGGAVVADQHSVATKLRYELSAAA